MTNILCLIGIVYLVALFAGAVWLVLLRRAEQADRLTWDEREWLEDVVGRLKSERNHPAKRLTPETELV